MLCFDGSTSLCLPLPPSLSFFPSGNVCQQTVVTDKRFLWLGVNTWVMRPRCTTTKKKKKNPPRFTALAHCAASQGIYWRLAIRSCRQIGAHTHLCILCTHAHRSCRNSSTDMHAHKHKHTRHHTHRRTDSHTCLAQTAKQAVSQPSHVSQNSIPQTDCSVKGTL